MISRLKKINSNIGFLLFGEMDERIGVITPGETSHLFLGFLLRNYSKRKDGVFFVIG